MQLHNIFPHNISWILFIKRLSYIDNEKKKVSFHLEIEIGLCNLYNFRFAMRQLGQIHRIE